MSSRVPPKRIVPQEGYFLTNPKTTPAFQVGNLLFVGGQVARDRSGNVVAPGDLAGQFRQAMDNVILVLEEAGFRLRDVVKMNIYISDMTDLSKLLEVRLTYFEDVAPPSVLLGVSRLANPAFLVEVDAIAVGQGDGKQI
jgi:2-iminobutanoate/2-iminopropanoate deaminase